MDHYLNPLDPSTQHDSLAENLRDRGFAIAGLPEAPRDDVEVDEPDELQQGELPTGPTHVAARGTPRTKDQLASARVFLAAAGKVKFATGQATLKAVWMTLIYYASLSARPERVCFAQVKTIADRALVSERTVRYHLGSLAALGLIHTDNRTGGYSPTHWSISESSPSVLGGKDCRGGRQGLPGGAAKVAAEVSNRSTAPTEQVLLAKEQQTDGACAPPPAALKKSPQKTKREQKEQPRTDEPIEALAQGKTDTGGVTRGGATKKQIKFLRLLADRVGADYDEEAWRAADSKRLQVQMDAAKPFKDRKGKHTHAAFVEHFSMVGIAFGGISYKHVAQRCECGAFRSAAVTRKGVIGDAADNRWTFNGYLVEGFTWAAPISFSEVEERAHGQA